MKTYAKTFLSIILSLIMLLPCLAGLDFSAYSLSSSGSCGDNVTYTFNNSTGELVISGTGPMTNYYSSYSPFCDNSSIKSVVINLGVTSIGDYAFSGCRSLTSVTIPNSVTSIGYEAFYYCTSLTSVTIPNSVTSIGYKAFSSCTNLTSVTIPNSVTSIGDYAFFNVNNIVYNGTATGSPWGAKAVNGYVDGYLIYKDSSEKDLLGCFAQATNVTIPNSVTSIGNYAFYYCTSLTSVTIPDSVTSIGIYAFYECRNLTNVTIPDSVTSIENFAFEYCTSLTSVTIPDSVKSIGSSAFGYCTSLTSLTIPNSVKSIGSSAFGYCTSLTSLTIPNSVTSIGGYAFSECTRLEDIYYIGTETQWYNISKGDSVIPSRATIHYHTEHTYSIIDEVSIIPCARDGYTLYRCDVCGMEYIEILPMHTAGETVIENRIEPTCTEDGSYDEVVYCSVCNEELNRIHKILTKLGHTPAEKVIENRIEPTCTEGSSYEEVVYCTVCSEEVTRKHIVPTSEILLDSSAYPESPHNYTDNMNKTYSFSYPDAISLRITFSSSTATESGWDYIYLYNSDGSQIGKYDGTSLAGKTFTIDGNSFSIKLTSDGSQTKYGFSFSSIYAVTKDESLSALGHSFTNYISDDNYTCTEDGTKTAKCDRCDVTDTIDDVGSASHRYSIIGSKAPTCEVKGVTICQCSICGNKKLETSSELGHNEVNDNNYVAPTCTETGLTESTSCSRCNKVINSQEEIPALGHIEVVAYGFKATCTEDGLTDGIKCSRCDDVLEYGKVIKALGHDIEKSDIRPTCTKDGYTLYNCTRCDYSYSFKGNSALGHSFGEYVYNNDATCTKDGTKTAKCIRCEETKTIVDIAHLKGHLYEFFDTTATCTEDGFDIYICSACEDIDYIEVKAGHKFVCEVVEGELQYTCSVCGEIENKTAEDIKTLWNDDFVNSAPAMGEDGAYLDINNDGIINAKDYVRIMRMK